ncbi:hypothetical protein K438DRAFT_2059371, partial [Mycena galopus ATCC 62051]
PCLLRPQRTLEQRLASLGTAAKNVPGRHGGLAASRKKTSISISTTTKMDDETSEPEECVISHDLFGEKGSRRQSTIETNGKSAERVREQKRIKMAQKRIARMPTAGRAAPRARARVQARTEAALTFPNDANATQIESRNVSDAERDASESLVLMSQLHTPKRVVLVSGKIHIRNCIACSRPTSRNIPHDVFENWRDSPRVYEGGNSSEEDEMSVRVAAPSPKWRVINDSTSQFLEGVEEDFAPSEYSYEERSRSHPNPWLQPVPGGPDAKSNRLYAPSGIISRSLAAAAFPHLEYSSCDLVCNLRYSERKFNSLGLERA